MSGAPVDVVILTWNDGDKLAVAIESALDQAGVDVRVIVVDNGSDPPAQVSAEPRVRLVRNEANRGVAAGRNQGVRLGSAPYVLLLDSDARLRPGSLARLVAALGDGDEGIALAAPVFTDQAAEASAGRAPTLGRKVARAVNLRDTYAPVARAAADQWDVDFAIGACQLFRRAAYDAVGGIDESFFYGPEDVDFCLRLRNAGWRVVQVAGAGCDHPPRRRNRRILTRRGVAHSWAIARFLWRYRAWSAA